MGVCKSYSAGFCRDSAGPHLASILLLFTSPGPSHGGLQVLFCRILPGFCRTPFGFDSVAIYITWALPWGSASPILPDSAGILPDPIWLRFCCYLHHLGPPMGVCKSYSAGFCRDSAGPHLASIL